jgi:uncharacterized protein
VHSRNQYIKRLEQFAFKPVIKVVTGMRRVGKSTLLRLMAGQLEGAALLEIDKENMDWDQIRSGEDLHAAAREAFSGKKSRCVLMVDEVQEIEGWERALASIQKSALADIYCSGSNARVFSSELSGRLSGRYVEIPVHPLTYREFLEFSGEADGEPTFGRFLRQGGMPGIHAISRDDPPVFEYLRAITDTVILKDVVARHQVRNVRLLENILRFVLDTSGSPVSAKRIADYLKSQNIRTSVDTVIEYLGYFCDARALHQVRRHDLRGRKILEVQEKYYAADLGLRGAILGRRGQDIGIQLETCVCNHLFARGLTVEVGKWGDYEVDFVASRGSRRTYIQVAYLLPEAATLERELRPLRAIGDHHPRLLVSMDSHFRKDHDGIRWMNLREFLLDWQPEP